MPRINLLPMRQKQRRGTAQRELAVLAASALAVLLGLYFWYEAGNAEITDLEGRIAQVNQSMGALDRDVAKVKELQNKTKAVEQKRGVIDALQKKRSGPARMLDELAAVFTQEKKVWLTSLSESNGKLMLVGQAMEHEDVSDLQIALERRVKLLRNVQLGPLKTIDKGSKDLVGIRLIEWSITCQTNYTAG